MGGQVRCRLPAAGGRFFFMLTAWCVPSNQGVGGVVVALLNIFTLFSDNVETSAFIFFIISVAVIAVCIVAYYFLLNLPIVQYYTTLAKKKASREGASDAEAVDGAKGKKQLQRARSYLASEYSLWHTFNDIKGMAFLVGFNFLVTLAIFPGITANIASVRRGRVPMTGQIGMRGAHFGWPGSNSGTRRPTAASSLCPSTASSALTLRISSGAFSPASSNGCVFWRG